MLSNLQVAFFFVYSIIKNFKKVFMHHLTISNIMIYYTTIIQNTLNQMADCMNLKIVKS